MTVSFVSASTALDDGSTNGLSETFTIDAPATISAGNLLLAVVYIAQDQTGFSVTAPSGWTQIRLDTPGSSTGEMWVGYKFAGGSEPADYTWSFTQGDAFDWFLTGTILQYSGVGATVVNGSAVTPVTAATTAFAAPTVTATQPDDVLICVYATWDGTSISVAPPGMTLRASSEGADEGVDVYDVTAAAAGATGVKTATLSSSDTGLAASLLLLDAAIVATDGTTDVPFEWSATATMTVETTSWVGDDIEQWQIPFQWSCLVDLEPVEDPPPVAGALLRESVTMPAPTLVNGRPDATWLPTFTQSTWAKNLQIIIGGVDRSRPRGKQFVPLNDRHTEPFGDADASFAFPGVTEFDDPADFGLVPLATVKLRRKDAGNVFRTLYEGEIASLEPDTGEGVVIQCVGTLYRLDLLKQPPALLTTEADYGQIIATTFNNKRARYNLNIGHMAKVVTGIAGTRSASFGEFLTGAIQDYLAEMTTDSGGQWTIKCLNRTPVLVLKDLTTVHATISYGAPGVDVQLSKDFTTATTAVFGSGTNGHCSWMGARFPNLVGGATPDFPLAVGHTFVAGDGQTGFAEFAAFLRRGQYGTVVSDNTYDPRDVDNVEQFQSRAGITSDGIVGAQTWEAAFQPGFNQGSIAGAYVDTIYEKPATRKRIYNAQGADVGPNPAFDASVPRIEEYVPFGDNVSKQLGRRSAKQIIARNYPAGRTGTIVLKVCPQEMSRFDLAAGMNILIQNYEGSSVLVHVTDRERDWKAGTVTLTVDQKARDRLTAASIHQRNKDVSDLTRRQKFGRTRAKVFNDYGAWLCEDGAGEIPLMNQQGGFWNTQRIAAAPKGSIERISLAFGSGLTEHLLNENLSANPPASIPGAARGCYVITTQPITPNQLAHLPGLSTPLTDMADGTNPWDHNEDILTNVFGKVVASGGPGAALGFFPNNDPGDGSGTGLTGRHEDGGSINFGPTGRYWLWISIWTPTSCKVGGRVFPGAPG